MSTQDISGLGPGLGLDINPFDPAYQQKQKIATLVQQATKANTDAAVAYQRKASDWLINAAIARDAGRPIPTMDDPPLVIHIDPSTGAETHGPDTVAQKPVLPAASTGTLGSNGAIASVNPAPDRLDQVLAQNTFLYNALKSLQADVAAIKQKLGVQ